MTRWPRKAENFRAADSILKYLTVERVSSKLTRMQRSQRSRASLYWFDEPLVGESRMMLGSLTKFTTKTLSYDK
jgi:hypothetical protein